MKWIQVLTVLAGAMLAGAAAQAAEAGAARAVSIEDFVKPSTYERITVSPTGRYLAVKAPFEDTAVVFVIDRINGQRTATIRAAGANVVDDFWWANDTRLVASVAEKLGGVDKPQPNGELYAINADGSDSKQLFGYRASGDGTGSRIQRGGKQRYASGFVIDPLPGDPKNVLIATRDWRSSDKAPPSAELLDVYTGDTRRVAVGPKAGAEFVADHRGEVRLATAPSEKLDIVTYLRSGSGDDWRVFNDPAVSGSTITPRAFAADNRRVYATVSRKGKPDALYLVDLENGKRELLYESGADPGPLLLTSDQQDAYGVVGFDGKATIHVFDPGSTAGRLALSMQKAFPNDVAVLGSFSADGKFGLVHVFSDRNPGDFYLFDNEKKNAEYIGSARKWIDPEQMAPMQPIRLKARDGLELNGYLTLPRGSSGKGLPLIVNPHGGPHGVRDYWGFNPEVQLLASRGYAVLQLNYRGSGGYGSEFQRAGYRQWGLVMQDDLSDATRWAVEQGYADPRRLCIYGASYGGYAALEGVVREPDLYRCAVGYVGVYDLAMMYRDGDIPRSLYGKRYLEQVLGKDQNDLARRSPAANVDAIKAAVMIAAGGRDLRVPISQAKALKKALDQRKYPYEWLLKDSEGHGFYRTDNQVDLYTRMIDFFNRNTAPAAVGD